MKKVLVVCLLSVFLYGKDSMIETSGDIIQILLPVSAYGTTLYLDDDEGQTQFWKSFGGNFLTTHALKRTVLEERPNKADKYSFPSGHTSASFQGASFIHFRYGLKYAIIPYIGASFVGYSRVHSRNHYTHDVIAGAALGTAFSYYFVKPYKYKGTQVQPVTYLHNDTQMVGLNIRW